MKAEEENEASQVEARRLAKEKAVMVIEKENVEEKVVRLRQELKNPWVGFDYLYIYIYILLWSAEA